ncbi:aspartoacylase [Aureococcus anophagefferens]|nr:aspartoacylase [Aureococcus anophagefferens]
MRYVLTFLRLCLLRAVACKRIVVVGGTHGNEYTGVYLVKALLATPALDNVEPFLANTRAIALNRRFCDEDLNRCFSRARLDTPRDTVEAARGRARRRSTRRSGPGSPAAADLVVDLHTTTANMGTTIIVDAWCPSRCCAAYAQARLAGVRILFNDIRDKAASPYLASVGADALQIEVGPTPQGLVRADVVAATRAALEAVVEFATLDGDDVALPETVMAFSTAGSHAKLAWPVDADGFPTAVVHDALQDRDWAPLAAGDGLFRTFDGAEVPYDGSLGDPVYPIFINEAGYYYASSGRGIGLAKKLTLRVPRRGAAACEAAD